MNTTTTTTTEYANDPEFKGWRQWRKGCVKCGKIRTICCNEGQAEDENGAILHHNGLCEGCCKH